MLIGPVNPFDQRLFILPYSYCRRQWSPRIFWVKLLTKRHNRHSTKTKNEKGTRKEKEGRSGVCLTCEVNSCSMCCRETSWESRFCPWRLNRPHTWLWTTQCSVSMWSIGCWVFPWKQQKRQCPSANPQRGRRFTTTSREVGVGGLVMIHAGLSVESFHFKDSNFSLCVSQLSMWMVHSQLHSGSIFTPCWRALTPTRAGSVVSVSC